MSLRPALILLAALLLVPPPGISQEAPAKIAGVDVPAPKRTRSVRPQYPPEAQAVGMRGIVILELLVGPDGKVVSARVTRSVPPFDEAALSAALEHGVRAQLIVETPRAGNLTFTFAHALIPFALRESLSGLRLQRLHRRAVAALERLRPADVEALAYHSLATGERDKAVAYARQAAERALVLYAYEAAAQQLRSALLLLEAYGDREARTAVLERLADVSELTGAQLL